MCLKVEELDDEAVHPRLVERPHPLHETNMAASFGGHHDNSWVLPHNCLRHSCSAEHHTVTLYSGATTTSKQYRPLCAPSLTLLRTVDVVNGVETEERDPDAGQLGVGTGIADKVVSVLEAEQGTGHMLNQVVKALDLQGVVEGGKDDDLQWDTAHNRSIHWQTLGSSLKSPSRPPPHMSYPHLESLLDI